MVAHVLEAREREERQRAYLATPLLAAQFPGLSELAVRMRFEDPEGKEKPQPYAQIFAPDMHAFFQFQCPLRECTGGGFDLSAVVPRGLSAKGAAHHGTMTCGGRRRRSHGGTDRCGLRLDYELVPLGQAAPAPPRAASRR